LIGPDVNLKSVFSGVSRPCDACGRARDLAVSEPVIANGNKVYGRELLKNFNRLGSLDRELCKSRPCEIHFGFEAVVCPNVFEIFLLIRGIDAEEEVLIVYLVDQNVIYKTAVLIEQSRVVRLPLFEPRRVIGGDVIHQLKRLWATNLNFAHMADVKQACGCAHGLVLIEDPRILHRHVPAAKIDHFGAASAVRFV
jgi:hypothetical protein